MNWPKHKWQLAPLLPCSWLYRSVVAARNYAYDKEFLAVTRVPAKVVSVGNLAVGGSGKTPTTAFLANAFVARGIRVAIVARGYRRKGRGACVVSDGRSILATIREAGDEPLLLAYLCPGAAVVVDKSKARAAQIAAERFQPQIILLDDGLQHRRLHRDLDLVLVSARMILHKPWLLPAGPLREPLTNAQRAGVMLVTDLDSLNEHERKRVAEFCHDTTTASVFPVAFIFDRIRPLSEEKNPAASEPHHGSALLVSGIAFPDRFYETATAAGVQIHARLAYGDHHRYSANDVAHMLRKFQSFGADYVLTTAKDAIKLREFPHLQCLPVYVLDIRLSASEAAVTTILHLLNLEDKVSASPSAMTAVDDLEAD